MEDGYLELYKAYCEELSQYDSNEYPEGQDEKVYNEYVENPNVGFYKMAAMGEPIGFLITMVNPEMPSELLICEAYVLPEYRHEGLMRKAVKETVTKKYSTVRFVVFKNNPAVGFWDKVMKEIGRVQIAKGTWEKQFDEYLYW